ncbi:MAG TPA: hypothetical protein VMU26_16425 [Candidatus Polarisedimenticolia bacterium]|nr:hypothetical protein [Candidatus Polarisedimenticolia bacterium]
MKSKPATKETGARISCIATAMKADTHEIPISNFASDRHMPTARVIPLPLASSVIGVVTQSWN